MSQRPLGFGIWGTGMIAEFDVKALVEIAVLCGLSLQRASRSLHVTYLPS